MNPFARVPVVNYIFIVSMKPKSRDLELSPEILYLTVKLIDYSLLRHPLPASDLHHLGVGALLTAWKDLDAETVDVDYLMSVTNSFSSINICNKKKILKMEKTSLQELANNLGNETQYEYLLKFIKASRSDREVKNMVHYLVELGMVHLDTTLFHPSLWAASAIYTVRCCLDKSPPWTDALESLTKYSENQLMECSKLLFSKHSEASGGSNLRAVFKKKEFEKEYGSFHHFLDPYSSVRCIAAIGFSGTLVCKNEGFIAAEDLAFSFEKSWLGLHIQKFLIFRKTSASILTAALASQNSEQPASSASNAVLPFEGGSLDAAVASPSTASSVQPSETKSTVTSASPKQNNACAVAVSAKANVGRTVMPLVPYFSGEAAVVLHCGGFDVARSCYVHWWQWGWVVISCGSLFATWVSSLPPV
ncbi:unnamed protein product [Arabidopsis arenosa]|uniref:Cyclin C-terminal domain-containing protein n=1 Tax=Arabidopsis arenosa TaxID=38785 RepID=A0A8S1ZCU0_ARAAE|nr:unnamed protein product [Arabidopsis arenosa]